MDDTRTGVSVATQGKLPKKASITRTVQRVKRSTQAAPADPKDLLFNIPTHISTIQVRDLNGGSDPIDENFVKFDSGPGPNRILIFGITSLLGLLSMATHWLIDGTFSISPKLFQQVVVVHALYPPNGHHSVPCAYALLTGKSEALYTRFLRAVNDYLKF